MATCSCISCILSRALKRGKITESDMALVLSGYYLGEQIARARILDALESMGYEGTTIEDEGIAMLMARETYNLGEGMMLYEEQFKKVGNASILYALAKSKH